jgi:hypothetical protein
MGQERQVPVWVNLRHEWFVPTSPLNPNLPPLPAHPQAAAVRHKPSFKDDCKTDGHASSEMPI